ncbi:MAG: ABC transporter substrate-binding protein, partial [Betaproteobacteria bacterium]|nr:ABC transporter substrate-binding protein [Betaproteobacteria bacterium]
GSKRLQLFKEAFPKASHVAIAITREPNVTQQIAKQMSEMHAAAKMNGLEALPIEIRSRKSFADAADVLRKWHADGISCLDTAVNFFNRDMLIEFAAAMKLPAIYTSREFVDSGGLMSYGANTERSYRRAATYVDKILKGAQPAELAVEVPTQYELVINQKTAKALGFNLPAAIVQKADKLIG